MLASYSIYTFLAYSCSSFLFSTEFCFAPRISRRSYMKLKKSYWIAFISLLPLFSTLLPIFFNSHLYICKVTFPFMYFFVYSFYIIFTPNIFLIILALFKCNGQRYRCQRWNMWIWIPDTPPLVMWLLINYLISAYFYFLMINMEIIIALSQ